jgi:predicted nucleotidyltransferase
MDRLKANRAAGRDQQMRTRIAQEAARLMSEEGIQDFYAAKRKAAQHLGAPDTRNMPRNQEVEVALQEYQRLFRSEQQTGHLRVLREAAVQAMRFLAGFKPRLVGSVLSGTAGRHADINLHLFADTPEEVSLFLMDNSIPFHPAQKRLRISREAWQEFPAYEFMAGDQAVELVVFPCEGRREAPRSPVDGRPMRRARVEEVEALLADSV